MTPDQQFIIAILTLIIPVIMSIITIVGGVILFNQQNRKIDAVKKSADNAALKSEAAEAAANHGKEATATLQKNFEAVVAAVVSKTPDETQKVVIVNPTDDPVPVKTVDEEKKE